MWFLRHKINLNKHKTLTVLGKVAFVIIVCHALVFFIIFYDRNHKTIDLTLAFSAKKNNKATVQWMSTPAAVPSFKKTEGAITAPVKNNNAAIAMPQKTTIAQEPAKKAVNSVKKPEPKKPEPKKEEPKKEVTPEKIKKDTPKTDKKVPPQEIKKTIEKTSPVNITSKETTQNLPATSGQESQQMTHNQEELFELINNYWHQPTGISDDCVVQVKVFISKEGNPFIVEMQRSKALIFDSSVQKALYEIPWPQWTHGFELNLTFKP